MYGASAEGDPEMDGWMDGWTDGWEGSATHDRLENTVAVANSVPYYVALVGVGPAVSRAGKLQPAVLQRAGGRND